LLQVTIDELGITEIIDQELSKSRNHALSHSDIIKAMVLNGWVSMNDEYISSLRFFDNLATEQLFGSGITPEHFNDDVASSGRWIGSMNTGLQTYSTKSS
jgi:transposase